MEPLGAAMDLGSIQEAVKEVTAELSFLPLWVITGIILALAVIVGLIINGLVRRVIARIFAGRPFVISLIERVRALTRLAFAVLALALVLPAVHLPPDVEAA